MESNIARYMINIDSGDWRARAHAARELSSYLRDEDARAGLLVLLRDSKPEVRRVAADALARCAAFPGVWPALILAQHDGDAIVREIAARALQPAVDGGATVPLPNLLARILTRALTYRA